jgi:UDP-N-acetylmuramoyl-L-alanyl-D-glutamate--2,6-diaminopimelate ligase
MRLSRLVAVAGLAQDTAVVGPAQTAMSTLGPDPEVTAVTCDSREVERGAIFFALPGHHGHGASFAGQAVESGASAVVTDHAGAQVLADATVAVEHGKPPVLVLDDPRTAMAAVASAFYEHPAESMSMIGVTGTNGKTTVTYLVQAALQAAGRACGIVGTLGTYFEPWGTRDHPRTTPEAPDLQRVLAQLLQQGATAVAMEVSSIAVCEHRVDGIEFDVMGFTGLSHDHLDYHGSMDAYFEAKARMFTSGRCRSGVVVIDDSWGQDLAARASVPITTVTTRAGVDATWRARRTTSGVHIQGPQDASLSIPVPTDFAVANAALAIAIAHALGIDAQDAADALAVASVPGRMEVVARIDSGAFIVDYAHTPDAIERVVTAAAPTAAHANPDDGTSGRVLVVLGAGGDRDPAKRSAMGQAAARADLVIVTDDNPRSEDPARIREAVRQGAQSVGAPVVEIADRAEAIGYAVDHARPGDVVLVLGKGHERTQEVQGRVVAFDDREVLASFVRRRFGAGGGGRGEGT